MDKSKAPGIDGFTAHFYQSTSNITGNSIVVAVQDFFNCYQMPAQVNGTLVTIIPKIENVVRVRDFRPIACCTILYKIISKVLANKLQNILPSLIDGSQSAFVKGRVISDNIILSHELVKGYNRKHITPRCMIKIDL